MLTSMIFAVCLTGAAIDDKPLYCPTTGELIEAPGPVMEFAGTKFTFCCAGCDDTFAKNPKNVVESNKKSGLTIGEFLFDPVTQKKITKEKSKANSDFGGIRYYFESEENKTAFEKSPKTYTAVPEKESLVCAVMGSKVASYSKASDYFDYEGVRYFFCCGGCGPAMKKDPAKYAGKNITIAKAIAIANK